MSDEQAVAHASLLERFELSSEQVDSAVADSLLGLARFLGEQDAPAHVLEDYAVLTSVLLQQQITLKSLVDAALGARP